MPKKKENKGQPEEIAIPKEEALALRKKEKAKQQVQLIQRNIMPKDSTLDELSLFIAFSKKRNLDPFARQIYCTRIGGRLTFAATIDGLRATAERSQKYAPGKKEWQEDEKGNLISATASVFKYVRGEKIEYFDTAFFSECNRPNADKWRKMPKHMLGIRAEAFALRRGFPEEVGGIYEEDEIDFANDSPATKPVGSGVQGAKALVMGKTAETIPNPPDQPKEEPVTVTVEKKQNKAWPTNQSGDLAYIPRCKEKGCHEELTACSQEGKGICNNKKCEMWKAPQEL